MSNAIKKVTALLLVGTVSGCGYFFGEQGMFRDRSNDYLEAREISPTAVPEGLDDQTLGNIMAIPAIDGGSLPEEFEVPRPQPLVAEADVDGIRIEQVGDQRWILVDAAPSSVWSQVRSFLDLNEIEIAIEDPAKGVLETAWVETSRQTSKDVVRRLVGRLVGRDTSKPTFDRYKIDIESGVRRGSSEVHLTQISRSMDSEVPAEVVWPESSENVSLEAGMLNEVLVYLARSLDQGSSVSLLAQGLGEERKVTLAKDGNGYPLLRVSLEFNRAWAAVGKALTGARIPVEDLDRSLGIYYVQYDDKPKITLDDDSFFGSLFGADDQEIVSDSPVYQVRLNRTRSGIVEIVVLLDENTLAEPDVSESLLNTLKDYLS